MVLLGMLNKLSKHDIFFGKNILNIDIYWSNDRNSIQIKFCKGTWS